MSIKGSKSGVWQRKEQVMMERVNAITKRLHEAFDDVVWVKEFPKNNGVVLHGVMLKDKVGVSPVAYVENFTEFTPKIAAIKIVEALKDALDYAPSFENLNFKDYDKYKDSIVLAVLNEADNTKTLCNVPFRKFEDLAVFIMVNVALDERNAGIVRVNDSVLELWGVSFEEAYEQAYKNTIRDVVFMSMLGFVIATEKGEKPIRLSIKDVTTDSFPIVITNKAQSYGASAIVLDEVLDKLAEITGEDLIIIPSSIHEVIVDVLSHKPAYEGLVSLVNTTVVDNKEVLSNRIYTYNRKSK